MNTVECIKAICKKRKIPISRLEKDCGFSNGYIGQLKKGTLPDDRLQKVAEYLNVNPILLSFGTALEVMDSVYINTQIEYPRYAKQKMLNKVFHYTDDKTQQYMQLLKDDKNANILLDAYRKMPPDQAKAFVDFAVETVKRYKDDE